MENLGGGNTLFPYPEKRDPSSLYQAGQVNKSQHFSYWKRSV